ncbi:MAG: hypothetical protein EBW42_13465 [Rhodobacterales bacterium]|nr:hypothetical protein [Rhodobacterales bacterium]
MTYLELVNDVLIRLRENEVDSVNATPYSKLIGKFVNDAKRLVEDSYQWNALSETLTVTTANDLFNYVMTGSGQRFKVIDVINSEGDLFLEYVPFHVMNNWFLNQSPQKGTPMYYNFNGVDENGDTQVDVFPIPDGAHTLFFNIYKPQDSLSVNSTRVKVPSEPVAKYAYAFAVAERGEDGGIAAQEATALADASLSDHIAIENGRYRDEYVWHVA